MEDGTQPAAPNAQSILHVVGGTRRNAATFHASSRNINRTTTTYATLNATQTSSFNVRMIPLGDIDLQHEIERHRSSGTPPLDSDTGVVVLQPEGGRERQLLSSSRTLSPADNDTGVVDLQRERGQLHRSSRTLSPSANDTGVVVRRVYSARVLGNTSVTVAVYQGDGAEEAWQQEVVKYQSIRHPNIIQIFGVASLGGVHAILFWDELIPLQIFLDLYRDSHFSTVYIYASCTTEFAAVRQYMLSISQQSIASEKCTLWIRRGTARLCVELIPPSTDPIYLDTNLGVIPGIQEQYSLSAPDTRMIITLLTIEEYHDICSRHLARDRLISVPPAITVNLGTVTCCSSHSQLERSMEIASFPDAKADSSDHRIAEGDIMEGGWPRNLLEDSDSMEVSPLPTLPEMEADSINHRISRVALDGWTRYKSGDVLNRMFSLCRRSLDSKFWLSQANHIFSCLDIISNLEDYVFVRAVDFQLKVSTVIDHPPPGFLSLCPETDFRTGPSSFTWPACPAYWSLDPSGIERLSTEEATRLGFPSIQLDATVEGSSWESSIYAGLRQFHQGKGFDPESQDVTRHLGYPLLSSTQIDIGFSRVDDKDSSTGEDQCLLNVEDPITEGHGRFSRPDSEDTDITLNGTETFFIYSPRDDQPETPIIPFTMKDLTGVRANLGIGGCLMSVHEPAEPASWLEDNWDNPLLISIRNSVTCSGPFAWMLSPTKPALAIFGRYNEPIVINMAQAIADLSGFPVVTRPVGHNPALTLLTHDTVADDGFIQLNNTGGPNQGRRRDLDRDEDTTTEDEGAPEETGPGGNGGRRDNNLDDTEANADVLNPEKQHEANRGAQGGGGGDGGEPTTLSGKSPLHRTRFKLRLKPNAADTYLVNIDHTLKFTVNPDTEIPVGIDDPPKPLFRPEVVAFVDFAIETRPRETQVDRSYANIGFVAHRKDSIDKRKFFRGGFELPRRTYKHGQQRQKQTGIQGGVSVPHNPMVTASISHSRTYGTTIEATDDKVMPRWSVKEEFGEEWEEDETSFSSFDVVYQPQDIRLEIEKSESHPLEVQVAMGINLRPAGSEAPLPQISFIHRNQALIWVSDPASKAQIRGILVLMSSYLDDVMTETRLSIYERADIVLGLGSPVNLPKNEGESGTVSLSIAQVQRQEATSSKGWRTWVPGFFSKDRQGSSRTSLIDIPQHEYLARGWDVDNNRWRSVVWPALDKHFRAATLERTSPVWKIQCPWGTGPMAGGANIQPRGEDTV